MSLRSVRRPLLALLLSLMALLLAACAGQRARAPAVALPPLHLAPAALGQTLALQQRLVFSYGERRSTMDALLEADADEVRLAVQALGQTGVTLRWDGHTLQQQRAPWLPPQVRAERVLDDLQFALWPAAAVRAALPPGWTLVEEGDQRRLEQAGRPWLLLIRHDAAHQTLRNLAEGYALEIESAPMDATMDASGQ
ncbi:MAG TPA: DUF3261 domain-containing protein [Stenotrophomonas sp.]|nr:DUF3261 domain-containing protein [Stenotrophomonas sp.]